jgi:hypothetical protein
MKAKAPRFHIHAKFSIHELQAIYSIYKAATEAPPLTWLGVGLQVQTLQKLEREFKRSQAVHDAYLASRRAELRGATVGGKA